MTKRKRVPQVTMVGANAIEGTKVLKGSKLFPCRKCGGATWISPSGVNDALPRRGGKPNVICMQCAKSLLKRDLLLPPTQDQANEISKSAGRRVTTDDLDEVVERYFGDQDNKGVSDDVGD